MKTLVALWLAAQSSLLQIRLIQGEGAVHLAGSRVPGLSVEITNEIGGPVAAALVSVRLPDEGPGGAFANGLSSEIVTTGSDGRATTSAIRWNRVPGPLQIRITVVKDRLRAGTIVSQYLSDTAPPGRRAAAPAVRARSKGHGKWIVVGLLVAGAAGAGFATGWATGGKSEGSASVRIGPPTVTIGKP